MKYCSRTHQKEHWSEHKRHCGLLQEGRVDYETSRDVVSRDPVTANQPFSTLTDIPLSWDKLEQRLCFPELPRGHARNMRHHASYVLTLAAALCSFNLDSKDSVCVNIVAADDIADWPAFINSADILALLPFPNMELTLIGPELGRHEPQSIRHVNGNSTTMRCITSAWHEVAQNPDDSFRQPDLVLGFHPGVYDLTYPWVSTLEALNTRNIPTVFTSWEEKDHEKQSQFLRFLGFDVAFEGVAPFASPRVVVMPNPGETLVKTSNSFWIGIQSVDK